MPGLIEQPDVTRPILEALRRDESEYVRRSVANHLNDLSRLNPALAVAIAGGWLASPAPTTERLGRHALRTLVKAANPGALALLGFEPPAGLGESATIAKRHSFKPISTRRYYAGEHALELQINGRTFGRSTFTLTTEGTS